MKTLISGDYRDVPTKLGLKANDSLFIASDVTQLALYVRSKGERFDVNAFIEAFQRTLSKGTIIIPAYTDHLKSGDTFDHRKAKPTTGALSNKVARRKDFVRSKDPLHSVFVWGQHAELICGLDGNSSLGRGSIFEWMHANHAKMMCIDVDFQNSLTYVHYVEEINAVSYRKPYRWSIKRIFEGESDQKEFMFYTRKPWVLTDLQLLQESAIETGVVEVLNYGKTCIFLFDIHAMHQHIQGMLDRGEKLYRISLKHFLKGIAKRILGRT
jgi:aminoglycoside 3-N-acetyltransferase